MSQPARTRSRTREVSDDGVRPQRLVETDTTDRPLVASLVFLVWVASVSPQREMGAQRVLSDAVQPYGLL
jgi:hypothetical protein